MWIVRLALQPPYTFAVLALLIVVLGVTAITQMRTDIFPEIDIPVVTVIWTYKGMEPKLRSAASGNRTTSPLRPSSLPRPIPLGSPAKH
jgi:Cu/Ag efflux pump CusA